MIILLGTMTGVVPYAFCTAALLQLLAVRPDEFSPRSRRQLLVIGSLGFAYSLWALYGTGQQAIFWGFGADGRYPNVHLAAMAQPKSTECRRSKPMTDRPPAQAAHHQGVG